MKPTTTVLIERRARYAADFRATCEKIDAAIDRLSPDQLMFYYALIAEAREPDADFFDLLDAISQVHFVTAPTFCGIKATPNAVTPPGQKPHGEAAELGFVPRITIGSDGLMRATIVGCTSPCPDDCLDTWPVREVTLLKRRGLVILDTDADVIVMTEQEFNSQV